MFRIRDAVKGRRQSVPGERACILERPLANFSATLRLLILSSVGGAQARPRLVDGDGANHVSRVLRTLTSVDCVHHDAQLEVHSTGNQ